MQQICDRGAATKQYRIKSEAEYYIYDYHPRVDKYVRDTPVLETKATCELLPNVLM